MVQELNLEVLQILYFTILCFQFYFLAYTECIAYDFIDKRETKTDFFILFHNALYFFIKIE